MKLRYKSERIVAEMFMEGGYLRLFVSRHGFRLGFFLFCDSFLCLA